MAVKPTEFLSSWSSLSDLGRQDTNINNCVYYIKILLIYIIGNTLI